jgi:hypothetical protein
VLRLCAVVAPPARPPPQALPAFTDAHISSFLRNALTPATPLSYDFHADLPLQYVESPMHAAFPTAMSTVSEGRESAQSWGLDAPARPWMHTAPLSHRHVDSPVMMRTPPFDAMLTSPVPPPVAHLASSAEGALEREIRDFFHDVPPALHASAPVVHESSEVQRTHVPAPHLEAAAPQPSTLHTAAVHAPGLEEAPQPSALDSILDAPPLYSESPALFRALLPHASDDRVMRLYAPCEEYLPWQQEDAAGIYLPSLCMVVSRYHFLFRSLGNTHWHEFAQAVQMQPAKSGDLMREGILRNVLQTPLWTPLHALVQRVSTSALLNHGAFDRGWNAAIIRSVIHFGQDTQWKALTVSGLYAWAKSKSTVINDVFHRIQRLIDLNPELVAAHLRLYQKEVRAI